MRVTSRDMSILSYLAEEGAASAEQLSRLFFSSNVSFRVRISNLIRGELIEAVKVSDFSAEVPTRYRNLKRKLSSNRRGGDRVKVYRLSSQFRSHRRQETGLASPQLWQHQIALNDIRSHLESVLPKGAFLLTDPDIRQEWARIGGADKVSIPDLVWRTSSGEIAFEVERNQKGQQRYFRKFAQYQRAKYRRVVYFAEKESIYKTLVKTGTRFPKIGVAMIYNPGKVFSHFGGCQTLLDFLGGSDVRTAATR